MQIRSQIWMTLLGLVAAAQLSAQTNTAPARLAIVGESPEVAEMVDVLTAEFSKDDRVQVLERAEIEKVIHEQQLSLNNLDGLKLGRLLGADGVLFLSSFTGDKPDKFLDARFVAVKPGVVLASERFSSPDKDVAGWATQYVVHLKSFVDKLGVLAKDAIPVSVVNFRSAVSSSDATETERQLQTLAVERLSREPRLFVLERQNMEQLAGEKDLSADETAFWNGAWLLEGIVDQNGYSKDVITLDARLTPAKGGTPILLEAGGNRTNFAEVINQLTAKVMAALQVSVSAKELSPEDEAAQFFSEAQWAGRWGAAKEAQAAADAAWALGKQDLECALLRIRSRTGQIPRLVNPGTSMSVNGRLIKVAHINDPPDERYCDLACEALECYAAFSRTSPDGGPKVLWRGRGWNDWHNSDWYQAGIETLESASHVLAQFNYNLGSQKSAAARLADLRADARAVAELIAEAPTVHDGYYVGNRLVTHDELANTMTGHATIFSCMVNWGCYWQERPEDTIALYHKLMESPVYTYIQGGLWHREAWRPRLVAWDHAGRQRIPAVWENFLRELDGSTNLLWRLEAHALQLSDIEDEQKAAVAFTNFFEEIFSNRAELVANPVEIIDENWSGEILSQAPGDRGIYSPVRDQLARTYYSNYRPKLEDMDREYWDKTVPAEKTLAAFERQKKFLRDNEPFDFTKFVQLFEEKNYSPAQAQEILPLIIAYKSNLLAQAGMATDRGRQFGLQSDARSVETFLQNSVEAIVHPAPPPAPAQPKPNVAAASPPPSRAAVPLKPGADQSDTVTNIISVDKFWEVPLDVFSGHEIDGIDCLTHEFVDGKLLLDFQVGTQIYEFDQNGNWKSTHNATIPAIAALDLTTGHWQVMPCPEVEILSQNDFYHRTTSWHGQIYTSDGNKVRRFDTSTNGWQELDLPDVGNCELFNVNGHLYAANNNMIIEILENGGTHILASNRRQPPVSVLDTENLGTPMLFSGPDNTLRAALATKIFSWDGTNWTFVCPVPQTPRPPMLSDDAVLFCGDGWNTAAGVWRLPAGATRMEYCMGQLRDVDRMSAGGYKPKISRPRWDYSIEFPLSRLAVTSCGSDIYLLAGRAKLENIVDEQQHDISGKKLLPQNGYHAELFCYSGNYPAPQRIFLKFDATDTTVPVGDDLATRNFNPFSNSPETWMSARGNKLFIGREVPRQTGPDGSYQYKVGIWVASLDQIKPEIERQKKIQSEQLAKKDDATKLAFKALLDQYDWNHDGVIAGEEKEAALTNIFYVKLQLDQIDTNQNGLLDPAELKFFDANSNNILDANEQTGIEIAQRLLAERLVRKYDDDHNGLLDRREFGGLVHDCLDQESRIRMGNPFPDENHDGFMDVEEVKDFLGSQLERDLVRTTGTYWVVGGMPAVTQQAQRFKRDVENCWQGGNRRPRPYGSGGMPPFMPSPRIITPPPPQSQPPAQTNQ